MIVHAADEAIVTITNTTSTYTSPYPEINDAWRQKLTDPYAGQLASRGISVWKDPAPLVLDQAHVQPIAGCAIKTICMASEAKTEMLVAVKAIGNTGSQELVVYLTVNGNDGKPIPVSFSMLEIECDVVCKLAAAILTEDHKAIFDLYVTQMAKDMASGREIR